MAGVYVVPAVDVLAVDGEAHSGQQLQDPLSDFRRRRHVQLWRANVLLVGLGQHRDGHGDGPVVVVDAHQQKYPAKNDEPGREEL